MEQLKHDDGEVLHADEVTCPACGHEWQDSWEFSEDDEDIECPHCNRHFSLERHETVTYSTKLLPCNDGNGCDAADMEFSYRGLDNKDYVRDESGKYNWVTLPKEKWRIRCAWVCLKCGDTDYTYAPYTEAEDPEINPRLRAAPMGKYEGSV